MLKTNHFASWATILIQFSKEKLTCLYNTLQEVKNVKSLPFSPSTESPSSLFYRFNQNILVHSKLQIHDLAEKAGRFWFEELHPEKIDVGTGKIQTATNGTFNRKYNMTIPKDLEEYEG